ncbi:MAG: DegT/DnrJ/EryC1/StrS family aminotransferase [bacterium]|nr:DegT/DnrJ/EryC1/StrS family aminotransferase [bacterium]
MQMPSDADSSGRSLGQEELDLLTRVIESGTLNCTKGTVVREFEQEFASFMGLPFCRSTSSGTAAVHAAVAAIDPEPGDEIVTTPITDMGAIAAILYQAAVPVFADVDPLTYNVTADTLAAKITDRTRALVVTHLFGNPCDMAEVMELAAERDLPVIEDCAQAYCTRYRDQYVGTFGAVACFSLQQGKHITAGEGGMVLASDPELARRMTLFIDKAWGYGDPKPDHYFLAPNYRMTELQGAVALAQLRKLEGMVAQRIATADLLSAKIAGVPGVFAPVVTPDSVHTYWRYALRVDSETLPGGAVALGRRMQQAGVLCAPRYVQKPAFECQVLRDHRTFGDSEFPYRCAQRADAPPVVYDRADTPGSIEALEGVVVLGWNERYREEHVTFIADTIREVAGELAAGEG